VEQRGRAFGREPWVRRFARDFGLQSALRPAAARGSTERVPDLLC
jgi:hypothetical protein